MAATLFAGLLVATPMDASADRLALASAQDHLGGASGLNASVPPTVTDISSATASDAAAGITVSRQWNKTTGDKAGPVRAGDVIQFHTAVKNTGSHTWTKTDPLLYESDLSGLLDDAIMGGTRQGTSASYCAPTSTSGNCGGVITASQADPQQLSHEFALRPGATHYFNQNVRITNDFSSGDHALLDNATVSGDLGDGSPRFQVTGDLVAGITQQHPDLEIVDAQWTKYKGNKAGLIKAGDVLHYSVTVQNTGDGDWTKASAWGDEKLVTLTTNVSELADDAIVNGMIQGTSTS